MSAGLRQRMPREAAKWRVPEARTSLAPLRTNPLKRKANKDQRGSSRMDKEKKREERKS